MDHRIDADWTVIVREEFISISTILHSNRLGYEPEVSATDSISSRGDTDRMRAYCLLFDRWRTREAPKSIVETGHGVLAIR